MSLSLNLNSQPEYRTPHGCRWLAGFEWFFLLLGLAALDTYVWVNTSTVLYQASVVDPHDRTAPNGTETDNWSTKGNVNSETGKRGTKTPKK